MLLVIRYTLIPEVKIEKKICILESMKKLLIWMSEVGRSHLR